jgi:hypothetical protein
MEDKKPRKLNIILSELVEAARKDPGSEHSTHLKNGLVIIISKFGERYLLVLRRGKVWPSDIEWKTVIKNWPYMMYCEFQRHESPSGGNYLSGYLHERSSYTFPLPLE